MSAFVIFSTLSLIPQWPFCCFFTQPTAYGSSSTLQVEATLFDTDHDLEVIDSL